MYYKYFVLLPALRMGTEMSFLPGLSLSCKAPVCFDCKPITRSLATKLKFSLQF